MQDQILSEIKALQQAITNLNNTLKSIDGNVERLRSVENLLERMVESNDNIAQRWDQAWQMYDEMRKNQTK